MTLDEIRHSVDEHGRVVDRALAEKTGWQTMHAFAWTVELEDSDHQGSFQATDPTQQFRHGQRFRLRLESATNLYIYVLIRNADGSEDVLLPKPDEQVPLMAPGRPVYLPSDGAFRFTPPAGREQLRLLASPQVLPWVTSCELWKAQDGDTLTVEEQATLAQLRSIRTKSIHQAIKRQASMHRATSVRSAAESAARGTLARGAEIVAVEMAERANLVTYATPARDAKPVIVHDIALRHVK